MPFLRMSVSQVLLIALFVVASCGGPGSAVNGVVAMDLRDDAPVTAREGSWSGRYLWVYCLGRIDPGGSRVVMAPLGEVANHWNVLKFLEQGPCDKCVRVVSVAPSGDGTLLFDVEIRHPFLTACLTGFDVRGIVLFNGGHGFVESGLTAPDRASGGGELMNADGFTTLYKGSTSGSGPGGLQGYLKGRFASASVPDADLNGYRRYYNDDAFNTRHAFYADTSLIATYEVDIPSSPAVFGYAVDANWAPALISPVTDPQTDFPPEANCPEPYELVCLEQPVGPGLTDVGGETILKITVWDYQGEASHKAPAVECAELFDGILTADQSASGPGWSEYDVHITNEKKAGVGEYKCLVSVEDNDNATAPPWLDLTAYQIHKLKVAPAQPDHHELWYYHSVNLLPEANLTAAIELLGEAKAAGYEKVVLADFKLGTIDIQSETYWEHVQTYADAASSIGIEVVPSLVPIGYSDAVLCHDPNLIEGQPVVDCVFRVDGESADVEQDPATFVANGDFEDHTGDTFAGWIQMDGAGVETFADTSVKHSGNVSIRFENFTNHPYGNDRIRQAIAVKPWNCYAVSFWLKTESLVPTDGYNVLVFDSEFESNLEFLSYQIHQTEDWTQYYTIFNSQDNETVNVYFGMWGGESGRFWLDDITIENAGLVNLVRRGGCPLSVTNEDGTIVYEEGVDLEYVIDPLMGHAGGYTGTFDLYHERPVITLSAGSSIEDGQKLLVDYYHCTFVYDMQTACCLTEPAVYDIFDSTLSKVSELIDPSEVFIAVDELRVVNWCKLCQSQGKTPGELLADATERVDQIAHSINPAWKLIVWSDMYDPNHNAHDDYYLANGTLAGSWEGLASSWDVANWYRHNENTLAWFEELDHRQILCGYYDESGPDFTIDEWLDMSKPYSGVYAVMYTTWQHDYSDLAAWADVVKQWDEENW